MELIMDKIAILIPCYNEEKTIKKVVDDFKKTLPSATIYVYNNNSDDRTAQIAARSGAIVRNEFQQGKGNVIRRMFREIDAECYILVDGDNTYSASDAKKMIDLVLNKSVDMVVGDRLSSSYYSENKRPFHNVGNSFVKKAIHFIFKGNINDILTGYRAFSYGFVKTFPVLTKGFEIETEMSIHAIDKRMSVENVTIKYQDRPDGSESKLNTIPDGIKVIFQIIKMFRIYRPMLFFGSIAIILSVVSVIFLIPVLNTFIKTGLVPNFPTLIVCCFVLMISVQSFFCWLSSANVKGKRQTRF